MTTLLLVRPWRAAASDNARFAQLHDEVGVSTSGTAGVDPGIEVGGRLRVLVAEQLPHQLVGTRVFVEDDLGGEVPELMRGQLHPQLLSARFSRLRVVIAACVLGLPAQVTNTASGRLPVTAGAISLR